MLKPPVITEMWNHPVLGEQKDQVVVWLHRVDVGMEHTGFSCETAMPLNVSRFKNLRYVFIKLKVHLQDSITCGDTGRRGFVNTAYRSPVTLWRYWKRAVSLWTQCPAGLHL